MTAKPEAIHDPVYGAVHIDEIEHGLILSRPLQRLRGIRQLGLVDTVYPGAVHTRLEHSIGTMHMGGRMAHHLELSADEVRRVRIAGLLHDLGHPAFSHAVEGVLGRNPDLQPLVAGRGISRHEEITRDVIISHPFGDDLLDLVAEEFGNTDRFFKEITEIVSGGCGPLGQIITGDIDADRIDFLLRDSHHAGLELGEVDVHQIMEALTVAKGRVVLAGHGDYRSEMSVVAAESLLVARAHHYNALVHNPRVQSMRAMLLHALEVSLQRLKPDEARSRVMLFFREYTDADLMRFIWENGGDEARDIAERLKFGRDMPLAARFDHRTLPPETRMAISTISRSGRARKLFEDGLSRRYGALVDISTGSGVPRSIRTEGDGFLYDQSALAAGLVKALTRQITLSFFSDSQADASIEDIDDQASKLLKFIRRETFLPIEGLLILFHSLHSILSEVYGERILVPRIRNITWLYRTVRSLRDSGGDGMKGLFDYDLHEDYGFPYSERLFEDIQILVAMGMVYQDLRHYEKDGQWLQRYEYMLTPEGLRYAEEVASSYTEETKAVGSRLRMEKHQIPHDTVSLSLKGYMKGQGGRT